MSADELSAYANLHRLTRQREVFRTRNLPLLAAHYERSVFYQLNLDEVACLCRMCCRRVPTD